MRGVYYGYRTTRWRWRIVRVAGIKLAKEVHEQFGTTNYLFELIVFPSAIFATAVIVMLTALFSEYARQLDRNTREAAAQAYLAICFLLSPVIFLLAQYLFAFAMWLLSTRSAWLTRRVCRLFGCSGLELARLFRLIEPT